MRIPQSIEKLFSIFCNSITVSPVSTAAMGLVSHSKGLSLRFPRYISTRDPSDKGIEEAR